LIKRKALCLNNGRGEWGMSMDAGRAGTYIRQGGDYRAFIPKPLPPDPPLIIDQELWTTLSIADRALGRVDGATEILPNPNLFVAMYARPEAERERTSPHPKVIRRTQPAPELRSDSARPQVIPDAPL